MSLLDMEPIDQPLSKSMAATPTMIDAEQFAEIDKLRHRIDKAEDTNLRLYRHFLWLLKHKVETIMADFTKLQAATDQLKKDVDALKAQAPTPTPEDPAIQAGIDTATSAVTASDAVVQSMLTPPATVTGT